MTLRARLKESEYGRVWIRSTGGWRNDGRLVDDPDRWRRKGQVKPGEIVEGAVASDLSLSLSSCLLREGDLGLQ